MLEVWPDGVTTTLSIIMPLVPPVSGGRALKVAGIPFVMLYDIMQPPLVEPPLALQEVFTPTNSQSVCGVAPVLKTSAAGEHCVAARAKTIAATPGAALSTPAALKPML